MRRKQITVKQLCYVFIVTALVCVIIRPLIIEPQQQRSEIGRLQELCSKKGGYVHVDHGVVTALFFGGSGGANRDLKGIKWHHINTLVMIELRGKGIDDLGLDIIPIGELPLLSRVDCVGTDISVRKLRDKSEQFANITFANSEFVFRAGRICKTF